MKLSIITINYNNKEGLQKTIDSVVCQTWHDFEWIVIDGGSTDGSKELIEQYQQYLAYWCSEPDKGVYNAMNKGADHAKGDYLLFLNSGDVLYDKDVLKKVGDLKLDADIISGQVERMDNHQPLRTYDESILMQLYYDTLNHQGTFIKRILFNDLKYDESLKVVSDWKFWLETIIWRNASVETIDMFVARQDMTGVSAIVDSAHIQERELIKQSLFPPRILKELQDYQTLRNTPYVYGMKYIEKCNYVIFLFFRKLISLVYRFLYRPTI